MSQSKRQLHLDQINAYTRRVSRLEVLIDSLESHAFETGETVSESVQAIAGFLGDEIRETKAEQTEMIDAHVAGGES